MRSEIILALLPAGIVPVNVLGGMNRAMILFVSRLFLIGRCVIVTGQLYA